MTSTAFLPALLASGGDSRISVPRGANVNRYGASPFPRATLGYASSTANDISLDAFRHLERVAAALPAGALQDADHYAAALEGLRARLRAQWALDPATDMVFAPSGTDLEYVALALAAAHSARPVTNLLLGADEVGSGCILSAAGRHFANENALGLPIVKGDPVEGLGDTRLAGIPVREAGEALTCSAVRDAIDAAAREAKAQGRHLLAHVVHGSKTGLVLPDLGAIDELLDRHGPDLSFVVDACQARLEGSELQAYLDRGCVVLVTGSKFMGGPPFSGFALVPPALAPRAPLPEGLARVFRRGEWPVGWRACTALPVDANPGLLLRLEASLFELEAFNAVAADARARVIGAFGAAVRALGERLGARLVPPSLGGAGLHLATLATLDLSALAGSPDIVVAQRWHRVLAARGLRLGQPVKCVARADGGWAGTLRISLSMPLIREFAALAADALPARLASDMRRVAEVIEAAQRPVVA
ncbi:hypothetical protein [Novosphingobium sp. PC22D]|uniref:hypothetical protein n=1 Tax=Novosphingobium sp. PC22D TaxID=1962403 RepID=UPI00143A35DB|nr:hypothetical protein [Novosphingobium sp. PC22D]